ncbi:MAG: aldehyde dehydrogenase [Boseongicola sp.]
MNQADIDALRHKAVAPQSNFIDGRADSTGSDQMDVLSPIDGKPLTTISDASAETVDRAVASARASFEDGRWSRMAPAARKRILHTLADLIERDALDLAVLGVRDNGTEFNMAIRAEPGSAAATFRFYAEAIDKIYGEIAPTPHNVMGLIQKEPVGVVGAIIPWNFPLMIGAWKVAPALAAGNSVVLKPAETASLSLLRLAELAVEAGIPDGVLNIVTGSGDTTGSALANSMDVDVLAFTGSGATGRRLLEASAKSNLKRVYLELGGKSPNVVFADTPDLEAAAKVTAAGIFRNSGQVCVAGSRLLVEASIHDKFVALVAEAAKNLEVGDPLSLSTDIGAVNSEQQLEQNLRFVEIAEKEGAVRALGGGRILEETGGYYMEPTILTGLAPEHQVVRKEVFGPVLSVLQFSSEEDAVRLANDTDLGLAAGVWTSDLSRAHRMVRAIRTGVVHVNTYGGPDVTVPMGGVKQSGNGVDKSLHALDKYINLKTAWIQL